MPPMEHRELTLRVPVPDRVLSAAARLRGRTRAPRQQLGGLVLGDRPALHTERRDAVESVSFFNARQDNKTSAGHALSTPSSAARTSGDPALQAEVDAISWYHTLELPGGVRTPGIFDHAELLPHYGLPADLSGKTALDVATFDGYWAFELERRGATVEALDLTRLSETDLPPAVREELLRSDSEQVLGGGFALAKRALGSQVKRIPCNVYDLSPETAGTYDVVHIADLLLHLERPLEALRRVRSVTRESAYITDCYLPYSGSGPRQVIQYFGGWFSATWWLPSLDALAQMVLDAGFASVELRQTYNLAAADEPSGMWRAVLHATV